jgi:hypothetical protein
MSHIHQRGQAKTTFCPPLNQLQLATSSFKWFYHNVPQRKTLLTNVREVAGIKQGHVTLEAALVNNLLVPLLVVRGSEENVVLSEVNMPNHQSNNGCAL